MRRPEVIARDDARAKPRSSASAAAGSDARGNRDPAKRLRSLPRPVGLFQSVRTPRNVAPRRGAVRARTQASASMLLRPLPYDPRWKTKFETLRDDTRAAIREGQFLDEARDSVAVDAPAQWRLPQRAHPLNISRAWRELEWE